MYEITRQHALVNWACTTQEYTTGTCWQGSKRGMSSVSSACSHVLRSLVLAFPVVCLPQSRDIIMNHLEITQQHKSRSILQRAWLKHTARHLLKRK